MSTITLSLPATVTSTQLQPQNLAAVAVTLSAPANAMATGTSTTISVTSPITISVTRQTTPEFTGTVTAGATAEIYEYQQTTAGGPYSTLVTSFPAMVVNGSYQFSFANPRSVINGNFEIYAVASYPMYPLIPTTTSNLVYMQIDNTTPNAVTDFRLDPASDTGIVGDDITGDHTPFFIGTAPAGDTVDLILSGSSTVWGTATASATMDDLNGNPYDFSIQFAKAFGNGQITLQVIVVDQNSGNLSGPSNPVTVTFVSIASDYNGDSFSDAALYSPGTTTSAGQWLAETTTEATTSWAY